ncbi:TPA: filamentous hemagglutinin, partial [Raoultella ornithinolytica]|nr:filamentous hemagglutinin [Raoultella ornithinolytica]
MPNNGDIVIAGSQLKAGGDTLLDAKYDVILSGAANTQQSSGKNSSGGGGGVGVSIGAGGGSAGISVFANVNAAKGKDKGNGTDWTETTIDSGKTVTIKSGNDTVLNGAQVNGDRVSLTAGNDLTVRSSSVAGSGDMALLAGNDLLIGTQNEYNSKLHLKQEKKSGLMGSGGIGFSYGTQSVKTTDTGADVTRAGSTVGSVNGDLTLRAGDDLTVNGSDLIAGHNMTLSGKNVAITAAENQSQQTHEVEQKTSGLTLALSGTAGSALNSVVQATQDARSAGSSRLQALQGVKAALSGVQASQAARLDAAQGNDPANNNTVGISLSYGSQSSTSTQHSAQTTAQSSTLTAGRDLSISAREGDLTAVGSQLKAGNDVALSASRDLNLISAENTSRLEGKNDSHGGT